MESLEEFKERMAGAKRVCVLTGAGISAESGIPTFRGGGESVVWKGMPFEQISSARMVREDLDAVWEWFDYRRGLYKECKPNAGHIALAEWQDRFEDFTLVTQNVDGLHERAGSENVVELHGNINHARCDDCGQIYKMKPEDVPHEPTHCSGCGTKVRPHIVLFGEMIPEGAFEKASKKAEDSDFFVVVGTSALVFPADALPEIAKRNGAYLIEINLEETPLTAICDESFRGKAGEVLPEF